MDAYGFHKNAILQINADACSLFESVRSIPGLSDYRFGDWEKTCATLPEQLAEETIRVAVVGAIKSGKSTFLNSLLQGDFLKRGAGVVTSIVTRVRPGDRLRATLYFKSWAEVNEDMEQALVLFPSLSWRSEGQRFDIRRQTERSDLQNALNALNADQRISDDARNRNMVLLSCYLQGYAAVSGILAEKPVTRHFESERFIEHWKFAGNESLAVYLRDIELYVNSGGVGSNIEIADCQGSDSSNPLHLAMIQDYLRLAHLLVYVVSSRTGLRRADIQFLNMIKKMGILDNTLFVVNCDFSEHQSIEDLKAVVARVRDELSLLRHQPDVYALSALFNLFSVQNGKLTEKDRRRLEYWQTETDLVHFSGEETRRFDAAFQEILDHKSYSLLFQNHIERLNAITAGMTHWIAVNRDILSRDASSAHQIAERIRRHRQRFGQILTAIQSSISGVVQKIQQETGADVNRFLDSSSGDVIRAINAFISGYRFVPESYMDSLQASGFIQTLYRVFQEFKQSLDAFIIEQINPNIVRFIASEEEKIRDSLESVATPYRSLIEDAYTEFRGLMNHLGISIDCKSPDVIGVPSVETFLRNSGLSLPPLVTTIRYTTKIRTDAVLRRGLYRVVTGYKKILKKPVRSGEEDARALSIGMLRIKRETQHSLVFQLKDYQENLKFKYLFRLSEMVANRLSQAAAQLLQSYSSDFGTMVEHASTQQSDKERASVLLEDMNLRCQRIAEDLGRLKQTLSVPSRVSA